MTVKRDEFEARKAGPVKMTRTQARRISEWQEKGVLSRPHLGGELPESTTEKEELDSVVSLIAEAQSKLDLALLTIRNIPDRDKPYYELKAVNEKLLYIKKSLR